MPASWPTTETGPIKHQHPRPSAFEKRVKRRVTGRPHTFFAACPPGLGRLCKNELTTLPGRVSSFLPQAPDITGIKAIPGGVEFTTRLETACLAALFLGTPVRILMRVARFRAENFSTLEKEIKKIDWNLFLPRGPLPDIRVTTHKSRLYHSDAIAERCRPLIASRLAGTARDTADGPAQTLMVRGERDRFELSLDLSGTPLFKRGIKQRVIQAPLRENLAFALLTRLKFSGEPLMDPMCGSGTFSLEAAMIQAGLPPGFFRDFAFEAWPGFRTKAFAHAKAKISQAADSLPGGAGIFASDLDKTAVENLNTLCTVHPAFERISARCRDFFDLTPPKPKPGVIVLNPPYGLRLGKELDMDNFFKEIGKKLSADFKGWRAGIIYPEPRLLRALNLPLEPMPLFHGGLDLHAGLGRVG